MKLLIKIFIAVIILLLLLMAISYFWGGSLLEKAGSILLGENIIINRVYFTPRRLSFVMKKISVPGKNIYFPQGVLRLFPLCQECRGLRFGDKVFLSPGEFSFSICRGGGWRVAAVLDNIALSRLDQKFGPGEVRGKIKGGYDKGQLDLYGVVHLSNLSYNGAPVSFLDISPEMLQDLLQDSGGQLSLDFIYQGPADTMDELYRYRPGRKTLDLIKRYIVGIPSLISGKVKKQQTGKEFK